MRTNIFIAFIAIFLLFLSSLSVQAQEYTNTKELFKEVSKNYGSKASFSFLTNIIMYNNYTDTKPKEVYNGLIIKDAQGLYYKIKDMELVSFNDCSLKISNGEKMILYSDGNQTESFVPTDVSIATFLNEFRSSLKTTATQYICEFVPKKVTQIMCSKVVFHINKSNLLIEKQTTYLPQTIDETNPKKLLKVTPMIQVVFKKRASTSNSDRLVTNKRSYIIKNGKNVTLAKKYSNFQLIRS